MANIFLTNKCNLKCPYCFANEFTGKEISEISYENFIKAVDFIKQDSTSVIGLIGGEPTLHSKFSELLDTLINDEFITQIIIYTNGLTIDKYIAQLKNYKISLLINCNSPKNLGERYNILKSNILLLKENDINFTLGINIYSSYEDYNYIFDLLKIGEKHNLRFSTSFTNDYKENTSNVLNDLYSKKDVLITFLQECLKNNIVPKNDCNSLPDCIYTNADRSLLLKLELSGKEYNFQGPIISCKKCSPVIDIFPDLTAARCFGLSNAERVKISKFKSLYSLKSYFVNKIDIYTNVLYLGKNCENCKIRLIDKCGVCLTYKIKKVNDLKKYVQNV